MRRHAALTIGLCLLPLGMVPARASAQIPTAVQAGPGDNADQAPEQPAPPPATMKPRSATPAPGAERIAREAPPIPRAESNAVQGPNIRIELTLTEQQGAAPPTSKTVMLTTSDGQWGKVRSLVFRTGAGSAPLNVDARPLLLKDGRISCALTVEYSPDAAQARPDQGMAVGASGAMASGQTRLDQSLTVVLQSGRPLMVTQAADAVSDRKVTVEVKATVLQ